MRANDEHDPLDSWLNQQVQPLPPPPGTFELITRRARGRKLRKLAVTVAAAAAVAAAIAIAVPVGLSLHLTPTPSKGQYAADASPTSPSKPSSDGSATPIKSPTPAASPTQTLTPSSGPVPPNFQPSSVTFVSIGTAWVIGQAGTPGTCANTDGYICTSIARTDNAGTSWRGGHAPNTFGPKGATGVSGIRFLNSTYGWAFGPELWSTQDGGNTWTKVDTGARVTDLEASAGRAYALFATCTTPANVSSPGFAAGCTSYTLMTATAGSNVWAPVGGATSGLTDGGTATSAVLALTGSNGYLLAPDGTLYSGSIGGTWSRVGTGTAPCKPGTAQANGLPAAAQLALAGSTQLTIACNQSPATGAPNVSTSDDGGAHWTQMPPGSWSDFSSLSGFGVATSLAATPDDQTLTLATTTGIYVFSGNSGRWKASNATGTGAPSGGFSYVGMTTNTQGVALPANTSLHEIWVTVDGGTTWTPTSITGN